MGISPNGTVLLRILSIDLEKLTSRKTQLTVKDFISSRHVDICTHMSDHRRSMSQRIFDSRVCEVSQFYIILTSLSPHDSCIC